MKNILLLLAIAFLAACHKKQSSAPTSNAAIVTIAGNGTLGFRGDGGAATAAALGYPSGVAIDAAGNIYIADNANNRIRKVSASGVITTIAGNGIVGHAGDGGPATAAELSAPYGVAVDGSGNVYIADAGNNTVRMVTSAGIITTVAGNDTSGYKGDGGPATAAELYAPSGVAVNAAGELFIADKGNSCIRKVVAGGIITTIAGIGGGSNFGYTGDGIAATASKLYFPSALTLDGSGNVYIVDDYNRRVRKVNTSGIITTVVGSGSEGFSGDGGAATAAQLFFPAGVAIDGSGNIYVSDDGNNDVRKVTPAGIISTYAGNGVPGYNGDNRTARTAELSAPNGLCLDANGNLYISDNSNHRVRKVSN